MADALPVGVRTGITQEQIDECRGAKEAAMLADIRAMVLSGADLNAQDDNGATLVSQGAKEDSGEKKNMRIIFTLMTSVCHLLQLHIASANGYLSVGEVLLEQRAQVEVKDSDGWTPLHAASCWGQVSIAVQGVSNSF